MLPFIFVNIIVSATVVLLILFIWGDRNSGEETAAAATPALATAPAVGGQPTSEAAPAQATQQSSDGPTTHTVQSGDTLGSISLQYDVPLEDIMAANGISDPNFLQANQVLVIPIGGLPTATPAPTATATPNIAPTPIATEPPTEGEAVVEISEVIGVGSLADEAVTIINSGNRSVALVNWELSDDDGIVYTFGQVTLFGEGASILLHTETGQDTATNLYWGLEQPVWESGETLTLTDSEGTVRVTFTVP
jgi:LysM repeat protein